MKVLPNINSKIEVCYDIVNSVYSVQIITMKQIALSIHFKPTTILKVIGFIIGLTILFSALSVFMRYSTLQHDLFGLAPKFDMDEENTIPTYISSLNLLIAAGLLGIIALVLKRRDGKFWKQWAILGSIFFFLSLDESASLHEGVSSRFNIMVGGLSGTTHYAWAILGSVIILGFLVYFSRFIFSLPSQSRNLFIFCGTVYLAGALGSEALGGYIASQVGKETILYQISVVAEESLEMLGIYLFIWSLFRYISNHLVVKQISEPERAVLKIRPIEEEQYDEFMQERA